MLKSMGSPKGVPCLYRFLSCSSLVTRTNVSSHQVLTTVLPTVFHDLLVTDINYSILWTQLPYKGFASYLFMIFFGTRFKSKLSYSSVKESPPAHQSTYIQKYCDIRTDNSQVSTVNCVEICQETKLRFGISITGHVVRHVTESYALYTPIWMAGKAELSLIIQ